MMLRRWACAVLPVAALACGDARGAPAASAATTSAVPELAAVETAPAPVQIEMRHVRLHVADGVVLNVHQLRGEMISRTRGAPPVFDDPRSYVLQLHTADIGMDLASLERLMNDHILAFEDAPIRNVKIAADGNRVRQSGTLRRIVPVPFSMKASVSATPDGRLRLHAESIRALGIPATKLLDLLGLDLESLVTLDDRRGVEVAGDDIIIRPGDVLPPPAMRGHLVRAEFRGGELRQIFASPGRETPGRLSPPDPRARNYIYFSGSSIRFGKLTMAGADLQLIDADDRDVFDFSPAHYDRQLVAGYSKTTPQKGLKTYMPDYADLGRPVDLVPPRSRR